MKNVVLFSNGDFRDPVGVNCWPKQVETLEMVEAAFSTLGVAAARGNPYKPEVAHGFITTQAEAARAMSGIDPECVLSSIIPGFYRHSFPGFTAGNSRVLPLAI